jgi:hypothetical protein
VRSGVGEELGVRFTVRGGLIPVVIGVAGPGARGCAFLASDGGPALVEVPSGAVWSPKWAAAAVR